MPAAFSLRCPGWSLRVTLALAMALTPLAATQAQTPATNPAAGTLDTRWLTPETVAVGYLRPQQVLTAEGAELLPLEIFAAAGKKYFGIDPIDVKSITVAVEPMAGPGPSIAIVVESTKPFEQSGLSPEVTQHTEQAELNGKTYLKSHDPMAGPSFYQLNESTLIIATDSMLQKLVSQDGKPQSSPLISAIKSRPASDDLYVAIDVKSLRPLINAALAQGAQGAPPELLQFLEAPDLIRAAEFSFNLSKSMPPLLNVYANDAAAAEELIQLFDKYMAVIRQEMAEALAMAPSDDPVEQALRNYSMRRTEQTLESFRPVVDGHKLTFFTPDPDSPNQSVQLQQLSILAMLAFWGFSWTVPAREAARRNQAARNMQGVERAVGNFQKARPNEFANLKELAIAMHNYHDVYGKLPAHANFSDDGKPLLSWRVHLLPYMEEVELYRQFHLDEPWDSEHNKQLIAKMPDVFQSPASPLKQAQGKTVFLAPVGEGFMMDGTKDGLGFREFIDGTSKTLLFVEANPDKAVIWTKPDDLNVDPDNPAAGLGGLRKGIFHAAFADGHASALSKDTDPGTLKALFTRNGGEVIPEDF